jgi:hypothetical protein
MNTRVVYIYERSDFVPLFLLSLCAAPAPPSFYRGTAILLLKCFRLCSFCSYLSTLPEGPHVYYQTSVASIIVNGNNTKKHY